jgi:hypothetical protein
MLEESGRVSERVATVGENACLLVRVRRRIGEQSAAYTDRLMLSEDYVLHRSAKDYTCSALPGMKPVPRGGGMKPLKKLGHSLLG